MFCEEICSKFESESWTGECLEEDFTVAELNEAKLDWCKYEQNFIVKKKHFEKQKLALNLFCHEKGLYRSNTRVNPDKLKYFQEYPILLVAIVILHN